MALATDTDADVRQSATWALAGRKGAEVTRDLLTLATSTDTDPSVRLSAALVLAAREGAEVTRALLTLATDTGEPAAASPPYPKHGTTRSARLIQ